MGVGLSPRGGRRMAGKSRVSREAHARFCESLGVKFPGATRPRRGPSKGFRGRMGVAAER